MVIHSLATDQVQSAYSTLLDGFNYESLIKSKFRTNPGGTKILGNAGVLPVVVVTVSGLLVKCQCLGCQEIVQEVVKITALLEQEFELDAKMNCNFVSPGYGIEWNGSYD